MELMLISLAIAYMFTSKHSRDTAQAAYKAGKEPPGLVKARMRHESGGGVLRKSPGGGRKPNGNPAGHGAMRLMVSQRWANACEKAKDRADDKHRRWRAWYAEQAPDRDAAWRDKQANRIAKSEARADKFARARGIARDAVTPGARKERQAWDENTRRDHDAEQGTSSREQVQQDAEQGDSQPHEASRAEPADTADGDQQQAPPEPAGSSQDGTTAAAAATVPAAATNTTALGGIVDYSSAAQALRTAAERVDQYRADLSAMADGLGGKQWGVEVHGPIRDMDEALATTAGNYRDLAAQMEIQGDSVRDAEDAHPYVPGAEVVNA